MHYQISTHLIDPIATARKLVPGVNGDLPNNNGTPDSGFQSQDNLNVDNAGLKNRKSSNSKSGETSLKSCIYNALCDDASADETDSLATTTRTETTTSSSSRPDAIITPRMTFSPADSLDSNVTLVRDV